MLSMFSVLRRLLKSQAEKVGHETLRLSPEAHGCNHETAQAHAKALQDAKACESSHGSIVCWPARSSKDEKPKKMSNKKKANRRIFILWDM